MYLLPDPRSQVYGIEKSRSAQAGRSSVGGRTSRYGKSESEFLFRCYSDRDLAEKLAAIGIKDSERNITNKVNRGTFTVAFFVQCLEAVGAAHCGSKGGQKAAAAFIEIGCKRMAE